MGARPTDNALTFKMDHSMGAGQISLLLDDIDKALPDLHVLHWAVLILSTWFIGHVLHQAHKVFSKRE